MTDGPRALDQPAIGEGDLAALTEVAARWSRDLMGWGIPDEIVRSAEASPWGWPPSRFRRTPNQREPTHRAALDGLGEGGTVLDVGVGAGWGSLDLAPPATRLVGVDSDPEMLAAFVDNCRERAIDHRAVEGAWPDVASGVDAADVVVSAHVVYNVADIVPFVRALTAHATRRVVIECTARHPTAWMSPLWRRFHGLGRPQQPTADELIEVLSLCCGPLHIERWRASAWVSQTEGSEVAEFVTRRLCLPADRREEVAEALGNTPSDRENVTVWWETGHRP